MLIQSEGISGFLALFPSIAIKLGVCATGLPSELGGAPSMCGWAGAVERLWPNGLGECWGGHGSFLEISTKTWEDDGKLVILMGILMNDL